jgi:hypothetical protein
VEMLTRTARVNSSACTVMPGGPDRYTDTARVIEFEPHRGVLVLAPAGADAHLEAAVGQQVRCRRFLGQHRRHVVVGAAHPTADAQRLVPRGGRWPSPRWAPGLGGECARLVARAPAPASDPRGKVLCTRVLRLGERYRATRAARGVGRLHSETKRRSVHPRTLSWAVTGIKEGIKPRLTVADAG